MTTSTADILDEHPERAAVCTLALRQFGGVRAFQGPISTVRCHEDNVLLKQRVAEPGDGRVLVVDGGRTPTRHQGAPSMSAPQRQKGWG